MAKFEDCDCEEFELNDDTCCKYCGDPPAKHQAIQAKSGSQAEQATRAHLAQPSQVKQSVVLEPWKDMRLGWIPNALRTSGKFYNELMPQFYQSFWKFYPDHKTFRNAFIIERKRQYDLTTQLAGLNDRLVKFKSDKNEAAAGKYILDTYTPKPHDTTRIATLIDYLDTLMQSADELDKMLKCHDGALFLKDSQKLKSGRQCHHLFNEMTITKVIDFKAKCLETKSKLEEAKKCADDIFKNKFVLPSKSKNKTDYDNKWKIKKRKLEKFKLMKRPGKKEEATTGRDETESRKLFQDLGGILGANQFYCPEQGVNQITELETKDLTLHVKNKSRLLILKQLFRCRCFREEAYNTVEAFIRENIF